MIHRLVSAEQAALLRRAIANYRRLKKLLRTGEVETEHLIERLGRIVKAWGSAVSP